MYRTNFISTFVPDGGFKIKETETRPGLGYLQDRHFGAYDFMQVMRRGRVLLAELTVSSSVSKVILHHILLNQKVQYHAY